MVSVAGVAMSAASTMLWAFTQQRDVTEDAVRDTHSMTIATEIELSLLTYQRMSNLWILTREQSDRSARDGLRERVWRLLGRSHGYVSSRSELALIDEVARRLRTYFAGREASEEGGADLPNVVSASLPTLHEAVAVLETWRDMNEEQVDAAYARSQALQRLVNVVVAVSGILFVGGLLIVLVGVDRFVLRPILDLHDAVTRTW